MRPMFFKRLDELLIAPHGVRSRSRRHGPPERCRTSVPMSVSAASFGLIPRPNAAPAATIVSPLTLTRRSARAGPALTVGLVPARPAGSLKLLPSRDDEECADEGHARFGFDEALDHGPTLRRRPGVFLPKRRPRSRSCRDAAGRGAALSHRFGTEVQTRDVRILPQLEGGEPLCDGVPGRPTVRVDAH